MIYGIEKTTDLRYPETKVVKFTSRKQAIAWASKGGDFAWAGSARHDIPSQQQNWHHRLRDIYEIPTGERPPTLAQQRKYCEKWIGTSKRVSMSDCVAAWAASVGIRIEVKR